MSLPASVVQPSSSGQDSFPCLGGGTNSFSAPHNSTFWPRAALFNPLSQASNSGLPVLAVTPIQSPVKVSMSQAPLSSGVAQPAVASCRVTFSSPAVSLGPQHSSPLTSPPGSPMAQYTSPPSSPASQHSPASNASPTNSRPVSRASIGSSDAAMSPTHGANALSSTVASTNRATQLTPAAVIVAHFSSSSSAPPQRVTGLSTWATNMVPPPPPPTRWQPLMWSMTTTLPPPPPPPRWQPSVGSMSTLSQASQSRPSHSSSAAPPQRPRGQSTSITSGSAAQTTPFALTVPMFSSLAGLLQSATAAPPQRSISLSTTSTPASASSAVLPPQVNLLNRILITHCFHLKVLLFH